MRKLIFFAAIAAVAMTSCSKDDGNTGAAASSSDNPISMRAVVDKTTRAAAMTTARFTSFHVKAAKNTATGRTLAPAYLDAAVFSLDKGATWSYAPKAYYPADGTSLSFFAYAPIGDVNMTTAMAHPGTGNAVTFGYTVPIDQTSALAEDLLISSVLDNTYSAGVDVAYTFNHALSAATFAAQNKNAVNSELVYVIKKIEITNLDNVGTFTYHATTDAAGAWTNLAAKDQDYTAPLPESGVALEPVGTTAGLETALLTTNDFMILLPQLPTWGVVATPATGTFVEVTFSLRDGSGEYLFEDYKRLLEIPAGTLKTSGFEMGKRYDFTFSFDASNAVTMDVTTVSGWGTAVDVPL